MNDSELNAHDRSVDPLCDAGSVDETPTLHLQVSGLEQIQAILPSPITPTVRMIYLVPSDREIRPDFQKAIMKAALHLQRWYCTDIGIGKSFWLRDPIVETVRTHHDAAWYAEHSTGSDYWFWENTVADGFALTGGQFYDPNFIWVYYIDAQNAPNKTGGGGAGGVAVLPRTDLLGLIGESNESVCRWVGGLGHELGHALGLPHPPPCDSGQLPQSDFQCQCLMYVGYVNYPQTYFLQIDRDRLAQSRFILPFTLTGQPFDCKSLFADSPLTTPKLFQIQVVKERFVVKLITEHQLQMAHDLISHPERRRILIGRLAAGDDGYNRDPLTKQSWSWHLVPETIQFVELATEVCDGLPSDIENNLPYWIDTVGRFCPWATIVEKEM